MKTEFDFFLEQITRAMSHSTWKDDSVRIIDIHFWATKAKENWLEQQAKIEKSWVKFQP